MKSVDLELAIKRPFWSQREIALIYGYTYAHIQRLTHRPGFPGPQGDPPRYPQTRVREFMTKIGREGANRRKRSIVNERGEIPPSSHNQDNRESEIVNTNLSRGG